MADLERDRPYLDRLAAVAYALIRGDFGSTPGIFALMREAECPEEIGNLAEVFGLMSVKVEARELALERALNEVRAKNAELERAAQARAEFIKLFSATIVLLCAYSMTLSFLATVLGAPLGPTAIATQLVNLLLFAILGGSIALFLRHHRYPLSTFGVTWKNSPRALAESIEACVPVLACLVLYKGWLVHHDAAFAGRPVIEWTNWGSWQVLTVYALVSSAQELSCRGFMQTCIERLLTGNHATLFAILLGAAEFGAVHLHYSFFLAFLSFLGALLFGTLYARHRTIVGIVVCHYILGQCIFGPLQLIR